MAVGTDIVARYILNKIVKSLLVARLLALAKRPVHGHRKRGSWRPRSKREGRANERASVVGKVVATKVLLMVARAMWKWFPQQSFFFLEFQLQLTATAPLI